MSFIVLTFGISLDFLRKTMISIVLYIAGLFWLDFSKLIFTLYVKYTAAALDKLDHLLVCSL